MSCLVAFIVLLLVWDGPIQTECMVYHATFLGRNSSQTKEFIGQLHYQGLTEMTEPNVTDGMNCTWKHEEGGIKIKKINTTSDCGNLIPNGFQLSQTGFKVKSSSPFTLHVYQSDSKGSLADGYLAIPDEHLGTEYFVPTYCSLGGYCQIAVAGTVDETSLNIVFPEHIAPGSVTCNGKSITPSEPIPFKLNENDVLHIESTEERVDLSGTFVRSDKAVAVFIGARELRNASSMIEQIPPSTKWGTELVVAPNNLSDAGDVIKIITKSDDTTIHILGYSPFTISNAGGWKEFRIDWGMHSTIRATKPILVLQVMALNLYNDMSVVPGNTAMVLIPHIEQWTDKNIFSNCLQNGDIQGMVTAVASSTTCENVMPSARKTTVVSEYCVCEGRYPTGSSESEFTSHGIKRSIYEYCDGKSAVLLAANWTWNNEECVRSRSIPGDGLDNDCDGKVDEDICTMDDLYMHFQSTPAVLTGEINYKSLNVKGASPIHIGVQNCGVATATFRLSSAPEVSFSIHIGSSSIYLLLTCPVGCDRTSDYHQLPTTSRCEEEKKSFTLRWTVNNENTTIKFESDAAGFGKEFTVSNPHLDFDEMYMASFSGTANFFVELPEKDCGKVKSGDGADNYGIEFIVPKSATKIYLTNVGTDTVVATLFNNDSQLLQQNISKESSEVIEASSYDAIFINATGEIAVYAVHEDGSKLYGYSVLPVDVYGPYYHVYRNSSDISENTHCTYYTVTERSEYKVIIQETPYIYNGSQELFRGNRPGALFCGPPDDDLVQIPPHDSLGTQHYIPSLPLDEGEKAHIRLVSTEDSTVVIIRGNYDNLDTIELTGNIYSREVVADMLYNISSTKPIQVLLQINSNAGTSVVAVPSVEQYKNDHFFPDSLNKIGSFELSNKTRILVFENGTEGEQIKDTLEMKPYNYGQKVFALNILSYKSADSSGLLKLIVPGDVMYNSINNVCRITKSTPGDNIDNDCDGLTDEEQCTANIIPGQIDADIDGSPNDDCANGTTMPTLSVKLQSPQHSITCPTSSGSTNSSQNDEGSDDAMHITIDNGNVHDASLPSSFPPKAEPHGEGPSYEPVASYGGTSFIQLPIDTETTPNSTEDSTSLCDCVCPCGWVDPPKNYTVEELKAVVAEIQEKLKVSKASLSATVRAKSSAKDDRTEAAAVGIVGIVFLVTLIGAIFLLDLTTIARDVRMLMGNLRQVFQP